MPAQPSPASSACLALLMAVAAWQVLTRSLGAYLAVAAPNSAVHLRPFEPLAALGAAEQALAAARKRGESEPIGGSDHGDEREGGAGPNGASASVLLEQNDEKIKPIATARAALRNEPLSARALSLLGEAGEDESGRGAFRFLDEAVRRSRREAAAVFLLMRHSLKTKDYAATARYADVLLRTKSEAAPLVMPYLIRMSEEEGGREELKALLSSNPPWRSRFFWLLPQSVTRAGSPLDLLLALQSSSSPPSESDIKPYLDFLIGHRLYDLAYYTWLQFLLPDQLNRTGLLHNGDFSSPPSGMPFDWMIGSGTGVSVDIALEPAPEGRHALVVDFADVRAEFPEVAQWVLMPQGSYRFRGLYKGEFRGPRGLKWQVVCAGQSPWITGSSEMTSNSATVWTPFEFEFTIPPKDCRAQYVRLHFDARSASEQFGAGSIWYANLRIERNSPP